jgi:hypothetical protein
VTATACTGAAFRRGSDDWIAYAAMTGVEWTMVPNPRALDRWRLLSVLSVERCRDRHSVSRLGPR